MTCPRREQYNRKASDALLDLGHWQLLFHVAWDRGRQKVYSHRAGSWLSLGYSEDLKGYFPGSIGNK